MFSSERVVWWVQKVVTLNQHSRRWCRWWTHCRSITAPHYTTWWHTCAESVGCRWMLATESHSPLSVLSSRTSSCDPPGRTSCECLACHFFHLGNTVPSVLCAFSALTLLVGRQEGHPACKKLSSEVLAWLSVWSEVQTCIWSSWCHCHSLSLASLKSRLVLPFWYWLTRVVPDKGPLNGCVCVCVCSGVNLDTAVRFADPDFLLECKISAIWRRFPLIFALYILNLRHISTSGLFDLLTYKLYHTRRPLRR